MLVYLYFRCVLRGCVPKKLLVYASKYSHEFEESRGFGWVYETDNQQKFGVAAPCGNSDKYTEEFRGYCN